MTLIIHHLKINILPNNKREAKKVECRLAYFFMENERLYKRGFALPSLHYLHLDKASYVSREIHEGFCGSHLARTTITPKFIQ